MHLSLYLCIMEQIKLQLTTGNDKQSRRALDFYPTPPEATIALLDFLKLKPTTVWECASGNGAMVDVLKQYGHDVIATDIINGEDYLLIKRDADIIITNPPFNISDKFIEKAVNECSIVAFLLKTQYWHAKKRYKLFKKHSPSYILPLTWRPDFLYQERKNGAKGSPTMDVNWNVWIKGDSTTKYLPLLKPNNIF